MFFALTFAVNQWLSANSIGAVGAPLAVVVHKDSTADDIAAPYLRKLLNGDLHAWTDSRPVILIEQPDDTATQQRMLQLVLKTTPARYNRQMLQAQFQGKEVPNIKVVNSDANAIRFVWNVPGAVSIVDAAAAASSPHVKILKIDGKLPGQEGYLLQ